MSALARVLYPVAWSLVVAGYAVVEGYRFLCRKDDEPGVGRT